MKKHFHKALVTVITFMTVIGFYVAPAQAALMGNASVQLSNPRPVTGSKYIFKMTLGSTHEVRAIRMNWKTAATGGTTPTSLDIAGASLFAVNSGAVEDWTVDKSTIATGITMINAAGAEIAKDGALTWTMAGITNPDISQHGDATPGCTSTDNAGTGNGNLSAGTCFIEIQTWNNINMADGNKSDSVVLTYAITADVVMQAKIDPALTFVVTGVASGTTVATANTQSVTTNESTYNGLNFMTLTPNAIRLLAHSLTVRTNANNGYIVYGRMTSPLTGTSVNTNNIDPYAGNSADAVTPKAWTSPTSTTKNVNSGYLGYNTSQTLGILGFTQFGPTLWAPLSNGDPTADVAPTQPHIMMEDVDQNDGLTPTVVSYALEVDVYQPSDSYAGVLQYNVVPKY